MILTVRLTFIVILAAVLQPIVEVGPAPASATSQTGRCLRATSVTDADRKVCISSM
jgi:hypothetical protein